MKLAKSFVLFPLIFSSAAADEVALRDLAKKRGILFGSAIRSLPLLEDSEYAAFASLHFSILTPENDFKFNALQPGEGRFDFKNADQIVAFAKKNHQRVHGHTLIWHNPEALPSWLTQKKRSPAALRRVLKSHIEKTLKHFRKTASGTVVSWDVINEAFDDDGKIRKDSIWFGTEKDAFSFFSWAFRLAHRMDPKIKLYYNDYGMEQPGKKSNAVFRLLKKLKKARVPIHGVGFQAHGSSKWSSDYGSLAGMMKKFESLGLKVSITEMDYSIDDSASSENAQEEAYSTSLRACLQVKACQAFITWGFTDRYLWKGNFPEGFGRSTYLDEKWRAKAAFHALKKQLDPEVRPTPSDPN